MEQVLSLVDRPATNRFLKGPPGVPFAGWQTGPDQTPPPGVGVHWVQPAGSLTWLVPRTQATNGWIFFSQSLEGETPERPQKSHLGNFDHFFPKFSEQSTENCFRSNPALPLAPTLFQCANCSVRRSAGWNQMGGAAGREKGAWLLHLWPTRADQGWPGPTRCGQR